MQYENVLHINLSQIISYINTEDLYNLGNITEYNNHCKLCYITKNIYSYYTEILKKINEKNKLKYVYKNENDNIQYIKIENLKINCKLNDSTYIQNFSNLKILKILYYVLPENCDCSFLNQLKSLEKLVIWRQKCEIDLKYLKNLKNLKKFVSLNATKVKNVEYIENCGKLQELTTYSENINISHIYKLKNLLILNINKSVIDINNIKNLSKLRTLYITVESSIEGIEHLLNLKVLSLKINNNIKDISKLGILNKLNILKIWKASSITNINFIKKLKSLQTLELENLKKMKDYTVLEGTNIYDLGFYDCKYLKDLHFINKMKYIDILSIDKCQNLKHISAILDKSTLRKLFWYEMSTNDEIVTNILYIYGKTKHKYLEICD